MIYDTMVVTDLIITVYFPSKGKKVIVSDFACFPFIPTSFFCFTDEFFFFNPRPLRLISLFFLNPLARARQLIP